MFYPVIATVRAAVVQWCLPQLFLQVVNLLLLRLLRRACLLSLSLSLSLSLLPRLKFGAQNANTIKCWVIAFTSMGDN